MESDSGYVECLICFFDVQDLTDLWTPLTVSLHAHISAHKDSLDFPGMHSYEPLYQRFNDNVKTFRVSEVPVKVRIDC